MASQSVFHQEFNDEFGTAGDAPPAQPAATPAAPVAGAVPVAPAPVQPAPVAPVAAPVSGVVAPVVDGAQAPAVFRREIDLGDGSGKQVFEAATEAALLDKLTEAQTHGTRKIRQQQRQIKRMRTTPAPAAGAPAAPAAPLKPLTQEEEFMLGQNFTDAPVVTFNRLLEAATGMKPDQFIQTAEEVRQFKAMREGEAAAKEFVGDHTEDFTPTPGNERRILTFLEREGLALTRDNLEVAYDELSASGLLEAAAPAQQAAIPPVAPAGTVSTGLSGQGSTPVVPAGPGNPSALNVDEVNAMPLADARQRILHELHRMRTGQTPSQ